MVTTSGPLVLADRLRLAVGRLARRLRQQSLGGLTPSQRSVLATLDRHGATTMSQLAELEAISRPSATGITQRLLDQGLVERNPHPDDGRSAVILISAAGRRMLERGRRERTAVLAKGIEALSHDERRTLEEALEVLDRLLEEA
ncbi:MAG TPA: MarR family transcriptional regulator [Acidimicrobiia bacterium]|nr:MarR family transcriptional regulator [Acidimicrobiia bacterium]